MSVVSKKDKRLFQKNNDKAKAFFSGAFMRTRERPGAKPEDKPLRIFFIETLKLNVSKACNRIDLKNGFHWFRNSVYKPIIFLYS
jgi:hypothetical protein